jgi:beta-glucosidase
LHKESTVREWFEDPRGAAVLGPVMQDLVAQMPGGAEADEALGMGMMDMIRDMPLEPILGFFGGQLPMPAEQFVDNLLSQIKENGE